MTQISGVINKIGPQLAGLGAELEHWNIAGASLDRGGVRQRNSTNETRGNTTEWSLILINDAMDIKIYLLIWSANRHDKLVYHCLGKFIHLINIGGRLNWFKNDWWLLSDYHVSLIIENASLCHRMIKFSPVCILLCILRFSDLAKVFPHPW